MYIDVVKYYGDHVIDELNHLRYKPLRAYNKQCFNCLKRTNSLPVKLSAMQNIIYRYLIPDILE